MVYTHTSSHSFDAPWSTLVLAFLCRYPNPYSDHVLSSDILSRSVDPETRSLRTVRLLLKRGALPRWAPKGILSENWVLEICDVHCAPPNKVQNDESRRREELKAAPYMYSRSFNLEHRSVLEVVESIRLENSTAVTTGSFRSSLPFAPVRRRVERHGLKRFILHTANSRTGVALVVHALESRPKDFLVSHNFDFSSLPPHPLTSSATRAALSSVHHQDDQDETVYDDKYTAQHPLFFRRWSSPQSSSTTSDLDPPPPSTQASSKSPPQPHSSTTITTWSGMFYDYFNRAYRWLSPSTKNS